MSRGGLDTIANATTVSVQCRTDRDTLETAIEAWTAEGGALQYPTTLDEVAGYLHPGFPLDDWTYTKSDASYTLTGPC